MIYLDEPYATISWDDVNRWLVMKWKGVVIAANFKATADKAIELLKMKGGHKWLADDADLVAWDLDIQNWLATDWHPRAVESGLRVMAVITPKSALGRFTSTRLNKSITDNVVNTRYFDTIEEARVWLLAQP